MSKASSKQRKRLRWALLAMVGLSACGSDDKVRPVAVVGARIDEERPWSALQEEFKNGGSKERAALRKKLSAFQKRAHGELRRAATAYLAWSYLEAGDLKRAMTLAGAVEAGPDGVSRNVATVVRGSVLRRTGKPEKALAALEPLVGKIIDAHVREQLNRDVALAALEAKRFEDALAYLEAWLEEAPSQDRPEARKSVAAALVAVPEQPLVAYLKAAHLQRAPDAEPRGLSVLVARRLATLADAEDDAELARTLLELSSDMLGEQGDAVAELAVGKRATRVSGRTLGLMFSLRSPMARRRGLQVIEGLGHGLGLPADQTFTVVSRDDAAGDEEDGFEVGLGELTAQGAAVVVGGFDRVSARALAEAAERNQLPVILLVDPVPAVDSKWVFSLGADPTAVELRLSGELSDAQVVVDCEKESAKGGALVMLDGGGACAERTVRAARDQGRKLGLGPSAADLAPTGAWVVRAGLFQAEAPAAFVAYEKEYGHMPAWWHALGRDAAMLARAALADLPATAVEDKEGVKKRRLDVAERLRKARANELWTSEQKGLGSSQRLRRQLDVVRR